MELTTFFILRTRQIQTKPLFVSESTFKIKAISLLIFSAILLWSALICKQRLFHKNEIVQFFKTTNTKTLIETILKSNYKPLKKPRKTTTLKQPINFSCCSIFSYFLRLNCYNFRTVLTNQSIYIFVKFHFTL